MANKPRREWLSLALPLRWLVKSLILSLRSAIWTSGEPVSPFWVACLVMIFFLAVAVRVILFG